MWLHRQGEGEADDSEAGKSAGGEGGAASGCGVAKPSTACAGRNRRRKTKEAAADPILKTIESLPGLTLEKAVENAHGSGIALGEWLEGYCYLNGPVDQRYLEDGSGILWTYM